MQSYSRERIILFRQSMIGLQTVDDAAANSVCDEAKKLFVERGNRG